MSPRAVGTEEHCNTYTAGSNSTVFGNLGEATHLVKTGKVQVVSIKIGDMSEISDGNDR